MVNRSVEVGVDGASVGNNRANAMAMMMTAMTRMMTRTSGRRMGIW
jgi:hypothetical protein